ncbi:hypothetical protein TrCOL_g9917 [Triparma columacea]|uniref:Uncharacterized protein n=1 Tax=Triparma columacea TaxID=722753 RepID=A0A9W7G5I8_9STRA|nr:hypothetical protein TrCOL_g9917 [Triparma columacea]
MINEQNYRSSMLIFQELHSTITSSPTYPLIHPSDLLVTSNYLATSVMSSSPQAVTAALRDCWKGIRDTCFNQTHTTQTSIPDIKGEDDGVDQGHCGDALANFAVALEVAADGDGGLGFSLDWDSRQTSLEGAVGSARAALLLAERCYVRAMLRGRKGLEGNMEGLRRRIKEAGEGGEDEGEVGGKDSASDGDVEEGRKQERKQESEVIRSLRKKVSQDALTPSFHYALVSQLLPTIASGGGGAVEEVMDLLSEGIKISKEQGNGEGARRGEDMLERVMREMGEGGMGGEGTRGRRREEGIERERQNGRNRETQGNERRTEEGRNGDQDEGKHEVEKLKLEMEIQRLNLKIMEQRVVMQGGGSGGGFETPMRTERVAEATYKEEVRGGEGEDEEYGETKRWRETHEQQQQQQQKRPSLVKRRGGERGGGGVMGGGEGGGEEKNMERDGTEDGNNGQKGERERVQMEEMKEGEESILNTANAYIDKGDFQAAVKQFAKVLKKAPDHLPSLIGRATFLEKVGKNSAEVTRAYVDAARVAVDLGNGELAEKLWERVEGAVRGVGKGKVREVGDYAKGFADRVEVIEGIERAVEEVERGTGGEGKGGRGGIMKGGGVGGGGSVFQKREGEGEGRGEGEGDALNRLEEGGKAYVKGEEVTGDEGGNGNLGVASNRESRGKYI